MSVRRIWWISNMTFEISNWAQLNEGNLIWMLESDSDHHAFHQSKQYDMLITSKACETVTGGWGLEFHVELLLYYNFCVICVIPCHQLFCLFSSKGGQRIFNLHNTHSVRCALRTHYICETFISLHKCWLGREPKNGPSPCHIQELNLGHSFQSGLRRL